MPSNHLKVSSVWPHSRGLATTRERERETETDRQTDRQTDRDREQYRTVLLVNHRQNQIVYMPREARTEKSRTSKESSEQLYSFYYGECMECEGGGTLIRTRKFKTVP